MSESKKVLFIINKFSGAGYQPGVDGRIITHCSNLGLEASLQFTEGRGHATELAKEATTSKNYKTIFAVGGDGTVNEVAQGIVNTNQVMGILPKGSGNGLARHLGIPVNFKKSLQCIGSSSVVAIDTVSVNNQLSVNVSGIGFDGHIAGLFGKNGKRGLLGYSVLVLKEFFNYQNFSFDILIDDKPTRKTAFILAFANSSQFGNNARVAPYASVCDGMLDISFIRKVPIMQAIGFANKMFSGQLNQSAFVEIVKGKKISLSFPFPMPYHIDGEGMHPTREFSVEIHPATLQMLVPLKSAGNV
jgi:YegS/Rv2252/BmrU family lipid kinase